MYKIEILFKQINTERKRKWNSSTHTHSLTVEYKYGPQDRVESTGEIQESPIARPRKSHFTDPDVAACKYMQQTSFSTLVQ